MTKNLGKILNAFDFCSNIYGKKIICYIRKGNDNFTCDDTSYLHKYIFQEMHKDAISFLVDHSTNPPECLSEPLIITVGCSSYYGNFYTHTDPITKEETYMSYSDINPITGQAEHIIHSLTLGVAGNNCEFDIPTN